MKPELDFQDGDVLIALGTVVRCVTRTAETVTVGGYLIPFTDENNKDLYNTFWDDNSDLGNLRGNGVDAYVHHTYPLGDDPELIQLSERKLSPMTTRVDPGVGLWAETVLKLNDEYEAAIADMVDKGRLFWSSGSASHLVRIDDNGYVRRWPVIDGSLTPTPGTPHHLTEITTLRALRASMLTPKTEPAVVPATTRTLTASPSEAIWTAYVCAKMCAAICKTAAEMTEDNSIRSTIYSYSQLCLATAESIESSYYQIWWTADVVLINSVCTLVTTIMRMCGQLTADCASMVTDTTMNGLCTQSVSVCEVCAAAVEAFGPTVTVPAADTTAIRAIQMAPAGAIRSLRAALTPEMVEGFDEELRAVQAERAAKVLSTANHGKLKDARSLIDEVIVTHESKVTAAPDIEDPPARSAEVTEATNIPQAAVTPEGAPDGEAPAAAAAAQVATEVTEESSGQESGSARSIRFSDWNAQ
jgi:hypothetical protein